MRVLFDQATPVPIRRHIQRVVDAVNAAVPGSFVEVDIPSV
jgi:hypothetical protein